MISPANVSFADMRTATKNLGAIHEAVITSGSRFPPDRFPAMLEEHLRRSPDPDALLSAMVRFAEASFNRTALFNDLVEYPVLTDLLATVFGSSRYCTDILVRDPELFRWLTASDSLVRPRTQEFLAAEVERILAMFTRPERAMDGLKRLYRREILRVAVRDLVGESDLDTVTRELSLLADALICGTWTVARRSLGERFPEVPASPCAVLALGKLGGSELNYSSDVDLLVVYGDEGEFTDAAGRTTTHHEYFTRLTERIVQYLSGSTAEGHLYRVDMRLRPDGNAGPLVRSSRACLLYYEARGEQWERQMLIKARTVAGDPAFGDGFLRMLEPFIYPRTLLQHPAVEIARIKARIEAVTGSDRNVKLSAGGIRDIEFTVQTLQLLEGGKNPAVRSGNTLEAIGRLEGAGLLTAAAAKSLGEAYRFFRTVEHRLQIMENTRTEILPADTRRLDALARRCQLADAGELLKTTGRHRRAVRAVFDSVLTVSATPEDLTLAAVIEGGLAGDSLAGFLSAYRITDPKGAARAIASLLHGESVMTGKETHGREREAFRRAAGELFNDIGRTPLPDLTLANLAALAGGQPSRGPLYEELADPRFRKLVLGVCAASSRITRVLAGHPPLLEGLSLSVAPRERNRPGRKVWKDERLAGETRAAVRNLLHVATFDETSSELTALADDVVTGVFEDLRRRSRRRSLPLALFALGKYGTGELNFDADLDMIAVSGTGTPAMKAGLERIVATLASTLAEGGTGGYELDFRLRPEGKNAPLVVDRRAYRTYLTGRASLWERQSLTRLRFVCGDELLASGVQEDLLGAVYNAPLPPRWTEEVVAMRQKMETRSRVRAAEFLDIKLGTGGMADIEFMAQMLVLSEGREDRRWHARPATCVLADLPSPVLGPDERSALIGSYRFYRDVEVMIRLALDERTTVLPEGDKLERLARILDGSTGDRLHQRCVSTMRSTRQQFLRFAERLGRRRTSPGFP